MQCQTLKSACIRKWFKERLFLTGNGSVHISAVYVE